VFGAFGLAIIVVILIWWLHENTTYIEDLVGFLRDHVPELLVVIGALFILIILHGLGFI
jgi:hypothetical protein